MKTCDINKFYLGLKIIQDGEPCIVLNNEFVKPGKGKAFNRVRFRKLLSGKIIEKNFKSSDSVELANIKELNLIYLYGDGKLWYFMDLNTFEQVELGSKIVGDNTKWLVEQLCCKITFWNNDPIILTIPHCIKIQIVDIYQSAIKGDSISQSTKLAVLSTGAVIRVPLFINTGDFIKVNTRSSEYVSRFNDK